MSIEKFLGNAASRTIDPLKSLTDNLSVHVADKSASKETIAELAISTESLNSDSASTLISTYNNAETTIRSVAQDLNISLEGFQTESATLADMLGTNIRTVFRHKLRANPNAVNVIPDVADGSLTRPFSLEAYNDNDNRNSRLHSIVYNLLAARQDDFGETFFPTIVINPSEVGVTLEIKIFNAYNDFKRSIVGALADFGRKNVIRAYKDADILKNELTKAIPVLRTGGGANDNSAQFAASADVTPWNVNVGMGINVPTSALKFDNKIDLLGISQTDTLINSGIMGPTDSLDTFVKLEKVFIKVTDGTDSDIIAINVENLPGALFTYNPQGNDRKMILSLESDSIVFDENTRSASNSALATLPELAANRVRVRLNVNGNIDIQKGDTMVNRGVISVVAVRNISDGNLVSGATLTSVQNKISSAEFVGYTLIAYRANVNIRQRGQLIDSQRYFRCINIPYRSPLTTLAPTITENDDTASLQTLITATGIRVSNEAVTSMLKAQVALKSYKPVLDASGNLPEIDYVGAFYTTPVYHEEDVNMALTVDSIKSHEKGKDIRAALVEKIRFYANTMYRDSEYKAAASVLTGNTGFKPTVIVGTDPVLYNYISADGDLRTLGDSFDIKVVSTLDSRVTGKIFITFGVFDANRNTAVNPLNFGNMFWSPELTAVLPMSFDGQISKVLMVAPRFYHAVHLPVLTVLNVTNLPDVVNKVAVNTNSI